MQRNTLMINITMDLYDGMGFNYIKCAVSERRMHLFNSDIKNNSIWLKNQSK